MAEIGKYIYGIIPNAVTQGSISSGSRRVTIKDNSIRDKDIYVIPYQNIGAVVKDCEIVDYNLMFKDALAKFLIEHQRVIEKIMDLDYTIIPMRLGTFAVDEAEVKDILNKGYGLINTILEKIKDKIEIDVACTWGDFNSTMKEAGEEKDIKEFKEKLLTNPEGISVDDQMKIGFMLKKVLDKKKDNFACQIQEALKPVSTDFRSYELMDDKMVANIAFLINRAKREEFDREVEKFNAEFYEKLNFRCVGPLPPYSFCTLEIKKLDFEEIDWARKRLGLLNEFATKDDIKKAHQTKSVSFHPDKNPNTPGIEKEFNEIAKAYRLLWEYCQGQNCSFNEQDFKKNAVLVKVKD